MLDLLDRKRNLLITTVVDGSIFRTFEEGISFNPGITMMKL